MSARTRPVHWPRRCGCRSAVARIGGDEFAVLFVGAPIFVADRAMYRHKSRSRTRAG